MSLIEEINEQLEERLTLHTLATNKLWEVRKEVEKLANKVGFMECYRDGFNYYAPYRDRQRLVFKCYYETDTTYLVFVDNEAKEEKIKITQEPIDKILLRISFSVSLRLAQAGRYTKL